MSIRNHGGSIKMPRRKRTDDDGTEVITKVIELDPQDEKVRKILQSMPGGLKCLSLFRYPEGNRGGRPEYIDEISPDQFSFQSIKQSFGGGRFKVEWTDEDGTVRQSGFDIAGSYRDFKDPKPVEEDDKEEGMKQPIHPQPVTQAQVMDPIQLMMLLQKAEERAEARMLKMMEMLRPQQVQQSPDVTKQVFDIVEKIAPMMQGGDGGGASPWIMAFTQFKEPILKIVDGIHTALTRPAVLPSGPPPVQASIQPNPSPSQAPSEDDMLKLLIRQYIPVFINAARNNGNPDIYADMILEQLPESMYPKITEWLNTPTWFNDIRAIESIVDAQAGWWTLLRVSLLQGIQDHASSVQSTSDPEHSED